MAQLKNRQTKVDSSKSRKYWWNIVWNPSLDVKLHHQVARQILTLPSMKEVKAQERR